jgi:hypothetical protein
MFFIGLSEGFAVVFLMVFMNASQFIFQGFAKFTKKLSKTIDLFDERVIYTLSPAITLR